MKDQRPAMALFYLLIAGGHATRQELNDLLDVIGPGPYSFGRERLAAWASELADRLEIKAELTRVLEAVE